MENLKTNWKLSKKTKNPRSQQEIGCGEIETFWKQQDLFCFSQKNCPFSCQIPESGRKSGHQVGETALKWLDNTVKPRSKIVWRNCQFSTIQQRKSLRHLFCHRLMVRPGGFEPLAFRVRELRRGVQFDDIQWFFVGSALLRHTYHKQYKTMCQR